LDLGLRALGSEPLLRPVLLDVEDSGKDGKRCGQSHYDKGNEPFFVEVQILLLLHLVWVAFKEDEILKAGVYLTK
jgi:hypothetical protein